LRKIKQGRHLGPLYAIADFHRFFAHETPFFFVGLVFSYTIKRQCAVGDSPECR
jgi:hypothetical protein